MNSKVLNSERLILKPLSFMELTKINNNETEGSDIFIEAEAVSDSVKSAISKKLLKMQKVNEDIHEWYTYWLIVNKEKQKGIGFIGFKGLPDKKGFVEVGYSISPDYRKRRLMTEALETFMKWAHGFHDCSGITAKVLKTNIGSAKVLNNCGFKVVDSAEEEENYILKFR